MKKTIAALMLALVTASAFATARAPDSGTEDAGPSLVEPCWVWISNSTQVDGRRIVGFYKDGSRAQVTVYVTGVAYEGTTGNTVYIADGDTSNAYITRTQAKIAACYK